jgi:predicted RNase H-like HicB family nuclease
MHLPDIIETRPSVRLKILYEPSDEGGYTAYVPALPGCISECDTLEEARRHIREAIDLYLEPIRSERG